MEPVFRVLAVSAPGICTGGNCQPMAYGPRQDFFAVIVGVDKSTVLWTDGIQIDGQDVPGFRFPVLPGSHSDGKVPFHIRSDFQLNLIGDSIFLQIKCFRIVSFLCVCIMLLFLACPAPEEGSLLSPPPQAPMYRLSTYSRLQHCKT